MSLEINKGAGTDRVGVVATDDIVEGRMVLRVAQSEDFNFGGRDDLNGVRVPGDSTEASKARFVLQIQQNPVTIGPPYYDDLPSAANDKDNGYQLRDGFGVGDNNVPYTVPTYRTYKGMMKGQTILSGELCVAHAGGVYTVFSGDYIANANIVVDGWLTVANTADDGAGEGGKLKYSATETQIYVDKYDNSAGVLRFRTYRP